VNPRYYHSHTPPPDSQRRRCPVCHHTVYSLAGIHPQCAEHQADSPRPKGKAKVFAHQNEPATKDGAHAVVETPTAERVPALDHPSA
jgi:hypothetical protein